jgi:hypothetical protein
LYILRDAPFVISPNFIDPLAFTRLLGPVPSLRAHLATLVRRKNPVDSANSASRALFAPPIRRRRLIEVDPTAINVHCIDDLPPISDRQYRACERRGQKTR